MYFFILFAVQRIPWDFFIPRPTTNLLILSYNWRGGLIMNNKTQIRFIIPHFKAAVATKALISLLPTYLPGEAYIHLHLQIHFLFHCMYADIFSDWSHSETIMASPFVKSIQCRFQKNLVNFYITTSLWPALAFLNIEDICFPCKFSSLNFKFISNCTLCHLPYGY